MRGTEILAEHFQIAHLKKLGCSRSKLRKQSVPPVSKYRHPHTFKEVSDQPIKVNLIKKMS
jgi:hypothetical protein